MGRLTSVTFPSVDHHPNATPSTIPGSTITRFFAGTPLIVLYAINCQGVPGGPCDGEVNLRLDNTADPTFRTLCHLDSNGRLTLARTGLLLISPGTHTILLTGQVGPGQDCFYVAGQSRISIIELPAWDTSNLIA